MRHRFLLPWGAQVAGWTLLILALLFPVFIMLTWRFIDYGAVLDGFPYDGLKSALYLASGLIVFSREKIEDEYLGTVRSSSLVISAYVAGLWFVLINVLAGIFPDIQAAMNASRIPYVCRTLLEAFPDLPAEAARFLGKVSLDTPRLAWMAAWPGMPLLAFWIYIIIYKVRLLAAYRRMRNEK